jgi:hypothetical protein
MMGDKLTVDANSEDGTVWFVITSSSGLQYKELLWLREGFGIDDVCQAVLATGWVRQLEGGELRLTSDIRCETLRDMVEAVFGYFIEPGVPGIQLREIQSAVSEYDSVFALRRVIPLYAFAWLDVILREDLADEARSANRIWVKSNLALDLARLRDRRVAELVARYSPQGSAGAIGPLAPSQPTRQPTESRAIG